MNPREQEGRLEEMVDDGGSERRASASPEHSFGWAEQMSGSGTEIAIRYSKSAPIRLILRPP